MVKRGIPEAFVRAQVIPDGNDYLGIAGYAFNEEIGQSIFYIHVETPNHPGVVAHEAIHAAYRMLEWVGVEIDPDNHEALTYLVTWIMERFYDQFKVTKIDCKREMPASNIDKRRPIDFIPMGNWKGRAW